MDEFIKYMQIIQEENEKSKHILMTTNRQLEQLLKDTNKKIDSLRTISMETREELDKVLEKETNDFTRVALNTPSMSSLVKQETDNNMLTEETQRILQESITQMEANVSNNEDLKQTDLVEQKAQNIPSGKIVSFEYVNKKSIQNSVKPKTKIKKKAKKRHLNVAGFILASSLAISAIATPVIAHAINMAYPNQMIEEATKNYRENIFNPNTEQHFNSEKMDTDHYHDLINIMVETKEGCENPIVGFYLVYNNLDKYCKKYKLEEIFYNFNLVYKTDYTSLEDFLQKNNFKNKKEFEEYVGYELSKLSIEERGRGL